MSDLQCPARVVVLTPARTGDPDALRETAGTVSGSRLVRVYAGPGLATYARQAALVLGLPVGEAEDLDEIADLHPGEAVLVVRDWPEPGPVLMERDGAGWQRIG
ncbi:hypothetical protein [Nocardioides daejeonensis]|uniref:hypothetical protein n=1 Tax=Nocardioides daejeonensis TaxID=1046556 RepID=UPI000D7445BB|nr:hypothetical protein [Nocardioides daejeonensis]